MSEVQLFFDICKENRKKSVPEGPPEVPLCLKRAFCWSVLMCSSADDPVMVVFRKRASRDHLTGMT